MTAGQFRPRAHAALTMISAAAALTLAVFAGPAQAQVKLIVQAGNAAPDVGYSDLWVAQKAGFFKEEGLDVEVRHAANAAQAVQIVASGGADITRSTYEPMIIGYDKGIRGKIFYQLHTQLIYYVGVPEDSPIKTVQDFKGKRFGVVNMGGTTILVVRAMLANAGMKPDDVTFVPVGKADSAIAALRTKQIDGYALWDAVYATMGAMGEKLRFIRDPRIADIGNGGFFASAKTMADPVKHKALGGFARAVAKATVFARANPEAAVKMFWQVSPPSVTGDQKALLAQTVNELNGVSDNWDVTKYAGRKYGSINKDKLQIYVDLLKSQKVIPQNVPIGEIVTDEFVAKANDFDVEKVKALARNWK